MVVDLNKIPCYIKIIADTDEKGLPYYAAIVNILGHTFELLRSTDRHDLMIPATCFKKMLVSLDESKIKILDIDGAEI